ncbi:pectin lyase fold/virulence factor domain-containing protein [Rhizobium etli 8C-3]|uniref:Pectin lyase fold/virulence factor domain-containing protein n=1 Tax=Rhizobium etli 8C-3 TaxID=538025 RepID=A0A1L5P1A9_RHIET|nr:TIGR03808 family TAT-translocated repetitive protein [Rhizobium etli]APO73918.1 pectin lyase fold/virulence factor domain-containing protein [Rhizobium etli 8C-3]
MYLRRNMLGLAGAALVLPMAGLAFASSKRSASGWALDASGAANSNLQALIDEAARNDMPLYLPAGTYEASNLVLPDNARIFGVSGASRILHRGSVNSAKGARRIELSGIVIEGSGGMSGEVNSGLLQLTGIANVQIDNCEIRQSGKHGLRLERCGGRIERSRISGAAQAGIFAVDSTGIAITGNTVADCGNGGILVHRWEKGEDGTAITGNRVRRIRANDGGTGQNGNGINVFRAGGVMVADNQIADCAFSAVRANSGDNVQITGNQCLRSGETAIYAEFDFQGAVLSGNLVDGAANGISIANFNEGGRLATIIGNIVRNLRRDGPYEPEVGFGIGIAAEADTTISGNVVEDAPLFAMQLGWGPYLRNLVVTGNVLRKAPVGCAVSVAQGSGTAVITDNVFQEITEGAVLGFEWEKKVSGDLTQAGSEQYPHLTIERNRSS